MNIMLSVLIMVFALGAFVAISYQKKIRSPALTLTLVLLGAISGFTVAFRSLYEFNDGFNKPMGDYWDAGVLVPIGWFFASCFLVLYALWAANGSRQPRGANAKDKD